MPLGNSLQLVAVLFKDVSRSPVSRLAHWQMSFCFPLAVVFFQTLENANPIPESSSSSTSSDRDVKEEERP